MPADGSYARGSVTPGNREILWILRSPASRGRAHQTALDLLTDSGNPLLGPFGAVLGFGQLELQATDLIPCPGAKLLKRFFRVQHA